MKLLTFKTAEGLQLGVHTEQGILDVAKAGQAVGGVQAIPQTIEEVLDGGDAAVAALQQVVEAVGHKKIENLYLAESDVTFGPSVPNPGKIICVGLNYRKHAEESGMAVPAYPILFNKYNNAIAAHGEDVELPTSSEQVDYEAELMIVIGKTAKNVTREEALSYVFGYSASNDLSARDLQFRTNQWLLGKSLDGFAPVGPYLVTADEVGNPNDLGIRCYVNGDERQNSNTADMVFHCDEIISYTSQFMTLVPGDIILTGTPQGVIMGYPKDSQVWLQDGDEVTVEIDKLGRLTNRMRKA